MVSSRSHQIHLFWWLLLGLTASLATVSGQTISRIVETTEGTADPTADYTGQIRQFSEIGVSGMGTTPRPWACYTQRASSSTVQWQFPDGSVVPSGSGQATGSQFYQQYLNDGRLVLIRGPDYNSPDGEYCCVAPSVADQRRCVTLTTCPMLPFPANGYITYDPTTNVATHSCDPGYALSNTGQRTCQSNNQWSGTTVTCKRPCSTLPALTNGDISYSTTATGGSRPWPVDTVATHTCVSGFVLSGNGQRTCQNSGEWNGSPPTCVVICSDLPPLSMVSISYSGGTSGSRPVGTVATYSCNSGLVFAINRGNTMRTCQSDHTWSGGQPVCDVPCPVLSVSNGGVSYSNGITRAPIPTHIVATYRCTTGYVLTEDSMRTCTSGGSWTGSDPVCRATCLDLIVPANGAISYSPDTTPRLEGAVATHSCDVGYELFLPGSDNRMCQSDMTWTGRNIACIASCSMLTLNNGMVTITPMGFPILAGAVATHSCSDSYLLSGEMNRTCMTRPTGGGVWGGDALMCRAICDDLPNVTNAVITYSPSMSPRLMDSVATYTCLLDLPLVGNAQRTCQADRSWSGTEPYCQRVFFQLGGSSVVTGNNPLLISEVGVGDGGLVCRTDHPQCCYSSTDAVWLSPNNTVISSTRGDGDFYTTRGDGYITLNRYSNTTSAAGTYCCEVPVGRGCTEIFCAVLTLKQVPTTRPATSDVYAVALAVTLPLAATVIVAMATILIIVVKQLKDARTQLGKLSQPQTNQVYDTPGLTYEDVSKTDVGGASDHTHTPAMELSQCPAYAPTEVSTGRGGRGDVGEEGIYEN